MFRELKFLIFPANLPFDVTDGEAADVYLVLSCECDVTVNTGIVPREFLFLGFKMTFYHFVNCMALACVPFHLVYKYTGL